MSQTRRTFVAGSAAFSFAAGRAPAFAQQRLTPIRIVVTPVTNYTGLLVGRDKGWFEEQGLNVSWSPVAQTAIAVEATYGGSVEFGGGGVLEPMIARGNGLDMMLVVPSARIRPEAPDNSAIVGKRERNWRASTHWRHGRKYYQSPPLPALRAWAAP